MKSGVIFPYMLEWRLTDACNMRCKYCSEYKPEYEDIDYSEVLDRILKLRPKFIWFGGGEPTIVKQLPEIMEKLKKEINPHIGINTNLTIPEVVSRIMPFIDDLIVSIDTADERVCKEYRGIDPRVIIDNMRRFSSLSKKNRYGVNITVNSVVYKASLQGNGIEDLNNALYDIEPNSCHMFVPVYPEKEPHFIINDSEVMDTFFQIIERLKRKNRNIMICFPGFSEEGKPDSVNCYVRYFMIQLVENKEFYSQCPAAEPANPICNMPCNRGSFINDMLYAKNKAEIKGSPLMERLSPEEAEKLRAFVRKYINPDLPDSTYADLIKR